MARTQNHAHAQLQTTITEIVRMKNFPSPQYRKPARWWHWKYKTVRQQNFPLPPPRKTFHNECPTLGSLWPCYPFVSARFSSPIKKGEEKRKPDRFSFCSSRLQRIWIRLSQLKPTDLQLFAGVFPVVMVTSFVHLACTIRLFRVEGILVSNQAGCLLFFLIWGHFLSLLIGCSYCLVHNRICIVIMKYVIGKAFG